MIKTFASSLVLATALFAAPAHAVATQAQPAPGVSDVQQGLISEREAVSAARRAYPRASAINARFVNAGRPFYVVRMQEGSRLFDVRVDARTGRVLG
jgi:uncharacterized membrane protein YkoI